MNVNTDDLYLVVEGGIARLVSPDNAEVDVFTVDYDVAEVDPDYAEELVADLYAMPATPARKAILESLKGDR